MKILYINSVCKYGSTGTIVYDLYEKCIENGDEAAICYGRDYGKDKKVVAEHIYKFGIDLETKFHAFMTRLTGLTGCFSFFSTRRLIRYIKKFKPDVVNIHELHAYFVNIAPIMKYLKKNNIKTVWTFHCEFIYTGKCGYAFDCERWKTVCMKCSHKKGYPKSLFFDFTKHMFKKKKKLFDGFDNLTIITPSKWLADRVKESFLKDKKIVVIHNGLDNVNVFYPRESEALKKELGLTNEKVVLALAPDLMNERKGGKYVLKIANALKNERIKFILIGIDQLAETYPSNVIAFNRIYDKNRIAEFYSLADVFLICSEKENFPTTCIEALSCGTPVVGFDAGGTKETAPKEFGCFVEYGNVDKLVVAIGEMLEHSYKNDCREYSINNYSKKVMYEKYMQITR